MFVYKYLTLGGVEAVLRARLAGLEAAGVEAHAWFFHDFGGRSMFSAWEDRIRVGPVAECLRHVHDHEFDLLCSIDTEEVLGNFEGGGGRTRLVMECHSAYLENIEYLRGLTKHRPAAIFTPSEAQRRRVLERTGDGVDVRIVPNALCPEFVDPPTPFPAPPNRPVVAWIGRLDEQKNWEGFLKVAGVLAGGGAEHEIWIVGGASPLMFGGAARLLERARDEGILGRLRWFDGVPHHRMPWLFDAVRDSGGVVVSTSRGEAFGLAIVEAMARRCAVVAPAVGPFTEFIDDGVTGILFEPGTTAQAAERIAGALRDDLTRVAMGEKAREAVLARFAPEPALTVLAAELRRLVASAGTRHRSGAA